MKIFKETCLGVAMLDKLKTFIETWRDLSELEKNENEKNKMLIETWLG